MTDEKDIGLLKERCIPRDSTHPRRAAQKNILGTRRVCSKRTKESRVVEDDVVV